MSGSAEHPDSAVPISEVVAQHGFTNVLFSPLSDRGAVGATRRLLSTLRDGAELTIVAVLSRPSRFQQALHGSGHVEAILESGHRAAHRRLARCEKTASEAGRGIEASSIIDVGHPALSLVTRAVAAQHDLLVVSLEDDDDHALIRRLLRKSPCPVWVIRPTRAVRHRVLAAIDPEPEQEQLNRLVLSTASVLAGEDGELHVVNAWELYGESTMRSSAFIQLEEAEVERRRRAVGDAHERAVAELMSSLDETDRWEVHVTSGPAARVICDTIERHHIDTLVIGTVARSGIGGVVMGNTAERVLDEVGCSVVAVKPPGFVSPIHF